MNAVICFWPGSVWKGVSGAKVSGLFVPVAMRRILSVLAGSSAPWRERFLAWALRLAQRRAEAEAYARRRAVLKADDWLDKALPFEGA
jgi:hypothetical protein